MTNQLKKVLLVFMLILVGISSTACSNTTKEENLKDDSSLTSDKPTTDEVVSHGGEYIGYIQSIDLETKTLLFDDAEIITTEDTKRMEELKLTDEDMYTGFILYNEREISEEFIFDDTVIINLYDTNDLSKMITYSLDDFITLVDSRPIFCKISIVEGKVYNIVEQYLP